MNVPTRGGRIAQIKMRALSHIGTPRKTPQAAARVASPNHMARGAVISGNHYAVAGLNPAFPSSILTACK